MVSGQSSGGPACLIETPARETDTRDGLRRLGNSRLRALRRGATQSACLVRQLAVFNRSAFRRMIRWLQLMVRGGVAFAAALSRKRKVT